MKASELTSLLVFCVQNRFPVLIKGAPGIGKSDVVDQTAVAVDYDLIISHPVVSDPTDFKGLPFAVNGKADFLPFGDLEKILQGVPQKPVIFFLDDLGQASTAVQAACMQLILARRINGHKVDDKVTFVAATNRREDKAGVAGLLEPVKSRFHTIVELTVDTEDWVRWALTHNQPTELIRFIQFRPELLNKFVATRDIQNTPCPRTVAAVGRMLSAGIPEALRFEAFSGAAGEAFASEFCAFLDVYSKLPTINQIILDPNGAPVPDEISGKFAISGAISDKMTPQNIAPLMTYLNRLPRELGAFSFKYASIKNPLTCGTREFIIYTSQNSDLMI